MFRSLKTKYWLQGGRQGIRDAVKALCGSNLCKYTHLDYSKQQMGNLPRARLLPSPAFSKCALDIMGPFTVLKCGTCKYDTKCKKCQKKIDESDY